VTGGSLCISRRDYDYVFGSRNLRLGLGPPVTGLLHRLSDLEETSNVAAGDQAGEHIVTVLDVLLGGVETLVESVLHDGLELLVDLLGGPGETLAVLRHLETGNGNTTAVGSLARGIPDGIGLLLLAVVLKDLDCLESAAHVGTLSDELAAVGNQVLSLGLVDFVLGSTGKGDINLANVEPGAGALDVLETSTGGVLGESLALDLELSNRPNILGGDEAIVDGNKGTLGIGKGDNGGAELNALEGSVLSDVAGAGEGNTLALPVTSTGILKHVSDVVNETITGSLGANERATPGETLAGQDTSELVALAAVSTKHVADLTATNTNVTSGNIGIGTNVSGKLAHKGHAKAADLIVALALGVEVGTTLATTHHHYSSCQQSCFPHQDSAPGGATLLTASEGILENLLEAQELENGKVDCGVQSETTLVRAKGGVELDTVTTVDLEVTSIILPANTELNNTLGNRDDLEGDAVLGVLLEE